MIKSVDVGVLWKKTSRDGKDFLSGTMNIFPFGVVNITIFKNEYKTKDNQPDYKIVYTPKEPAAPGGLERSDSSKDPVF